MTTSGPRIFAKVNSQMMANIAIVRISGSDSAGTK